MFDPCKTLQAEQLVEIPEQMKLPIRQVQTQRAWVAGREPIGWGQGPEGNGYAGGGAKWSLLPGGQRGWVDQRFFCHLGTHDSIPGPQDQLPPFAPELIGILIVRNAPDFSVDADRWEEPAAKPAIWTAAGHLDRSNPLAGLGNRRRWSWAPGVRIRSFPGIYPTTLRLG